MQKIWFFPLLIIVSFAWACSESRERHAPAEDKSKQVESIYSQGDTLEISGSLVCAHCYALNPENTGHDHELPQSGFREDCAGFCATQGYPVGTLLDNKLEGERVWVIRTTSQIFADYMTRTVRVKGVYVAKGVIDPLNIDMKTEDTDEWITIM